MSNRRVKMMEVVGSGSGVGAALCTHRTGTVVYLCVEMEVSDMVVALRTSKGAFAYPCMEMEEEAVVVVTAALHARRTGRRTARRAFALFRSVTSRTSSHHHNFSVLLVARPICHSSISSHNIADVSSRQNLYLDTSRAPRTLCPIDLLGPSHARLHQQRRSLYFWPTFAPPRTSSSLSPGLQVTDNTEGIREGLENQRRSLNSTTSTNLVLVAYIVSFAYSLLFSYLSIAPTFIIFPSRCHPFPLNNSYTLTFHIRSLPAAIWSIVLLALLFNANSSLLSTHHSRAIVLVQTHSPPPRFNFDFYYVLTYDAVSRRLSSILTTPPRILSRGSRASPSPRGSTSRSRSRPSTPSSAPTPSSPRRHTRQSSHPSASIDLSTPSAELSPVVDNRASRLLSDWSPPRGGSEESTDAPGSSHNHSIIDLGASSRSSDITNLSGAALRSHTISASSSAGLSSLSSI
ncbi:hypothetical protein BD410DRAFT_834422 [Rickenella mellea]|uniref:Uncharacterized protein n=1 Tax=Rickenella mellea TaxID=50990 RepID=A0A4Y7QKW7_9AGAM|nr:hypothetical protein BD410DRAFT_834422 [Rickenella mellea]